MKYIVKGRIREHVKWGKRGQLRRGSYQFLPNTEIVLSQSNLAYNPRIQKRLWVRGKNKSGLLTSKGIYFKYLNDLKIEEVINPTSKTLKFIEKNGILFFGEEKKDEIEDWLNYFEEVTNAEILTGEINDELFLEAQRFVCDLQFKIRNDKIDEIINNYMDFPITIRHFYKLKENQSINKDIFDSMFINYFKKDVCESILQTEVDSIFPTERKILIGRMEVAIENKGKFKIENIIYTKNTL